MFVDFFIKRPVFTSVCSILILLVGANSIPVLPAARYLEIVPTQINVTLYLSFFEFVHNAKKRCKALLGALLEVLLT